MEDEILPGHYLCAFILIWKWIMTHDPWNFHSCFLDKSDRTTFQNVLYTITILIIIIIIKICSMHISTLLGAQGAETEKTWIQTIYSDSKNKIMYQDTCTMQLQIYIIFEKLWHKMSFKQRLKSSYTMTRFEFSWKMIPESRSRDRKRPINPGPFCSWFL